MNKFGKTSMTNVGKEKDKSQYINLSKLTKPLHFIIFGAFDFWEFWRTTTDEKGKEIKRPVAVPTITDSNGNLIPIDPSLYQEHGGERKDGRYVEAKLSIMYLIWSFTHNEFKILKIHQKSINEKLRNMEAEKLSKNRSLFFIDKKKKGEQLTLSSAGIGLEKKYTVEPVGVDDYIELPQYVIDALPHLNYKPEAVFNAEYPFETEADRTPPSLMQALHEAHYNKQDPSMDELPF